MMMSLTRARRIAGALLLLGSIAFAAPAGAQPQTTAPEQPVATGPNANSVNEQSLLRMSPRIEGLVLIPDPKAQVLVQPEGRVWRYFHEVLLHWIGAAAILGTIAALALFYAIRGRVRISAGRSGIKVLRFIAFERFAHWLTAVSFVALALTGLNITFGKIVLLPLIGPDAFSGLSRAAKLVHNFVSFAFVTGLVLIVALFIKDNVPRKVDFDWLKQGGGIIGSKHPPAGRFNAGEKLVFWFALCGGLAVAVSGYLLLFPFYATSIAGMQIAQVVHSVISIIFVAVILGHIYIGTLGMEGSFEAMGTGSVDRNWAQEHHRLWFEQKQAKRQTADNRPDASAAPAE